MYNSKETALLHMWKKPALTPSFDKDHVGSLDEEFSNKRRNVTLREDKKDIRAERSLATQFTSQANKTKSSTVTLDSGGIWGFVMFIEPTSSRPFLLP